MFFSPARLLVVMLSTLRSCRHLNLLQQATNYKQLHKGANVGMYLGDNMQTCSHLIKGDKTD